MKYLGILFVCLLITLTSAKAQNGYKIGDAVPDFKLKNIDGIYVSMAQFKTCYGFIIVFTCNHCPFAKAYQERIKALEQKYGPMGYQVIAINPNDPKNNPSDCWDSMKVRYKSAKFIFPYLLDEDQSVAKRFGATNTPHVYVLQKPAKGKGTKPLVRYIGAIDDNSEDASQVQHKYVEDAINALLQHKYPTVETTKAIGCGIKWKS